VVRATDAYVDRLDRLVRAAVSDLSARRRARREAERRGQQQGPKRKSVNSKGVAKAKSPPFQFV
jgi:hypothetical protein